LSVPSANTSNGRSNNNEEVSIFFNMLELLIFMLGSIRTQPVTAYHNTCWNTDLTIAATPRQLRIFVHNKKSV
jgi:hypothetical protein